MLQDPTAIHDRPAVLLTAATLKAVLKEVGE